MKPGIPPESPKCVARAQALGLPFTAEWGDQSSDTAGKSTAWTTDTRYGSAGSSPGCSALDSAFYFWKRQQNVAHILRPLPLMWETAMDGVPSPWLWPCLAWLLHPLGEWTSSLCLSIFQRKDGMVKGIKKIKIKSSLSLKVKFILEERLNIKKD